MKTIFYLIILLLVSVGLTSCYSQENKKATSNLEGKINDDIRLLIENNTSNFPNNTQISLALITENTTKYIGVLRKEDVLQITDNHNNIFEIGSISKVFTSILFSDFIAKKEASLSEKLQDNFNFNLKKGSKITLQQLANHTSGLAKLPSNIMPLLAVNPTNPYKNYTSELLEKYLKESVVLDTSPGTKNAYSNLGAGILGYILTQKSSKSYEELLQEIIFKPLNMKSSSSNLNKLDANKLIKGLNTNGAEVSNWDFTDAFIGAGGIKSTITDMEKFARKNFEEDIVYNLPQQPTFIISDKMKMGLGWHIFSKTNTIWHNGGTGGYRSCMAVYKDKKQAVVVLSNVSAFHKKANNIDVLCFKLLKLL